MKSTGIQPMEKDKIYLFIKNPVINHKHNNYTYIKDARVGKRDMKHDCLKINPELCSSY